MQTNYPIKSGQSLNGLWIKTNKIGGDTQFRGSELVGLVGHAPTTTARGARRTFQAEGMFPFRIYQLPSWYRTTPNPAVDWLKFCVRAGYITQPNPPTLVTAGTDGEPYGYDETFPTVAGAGVNEWALPPGDLQYFYYSTSTSAIAVGVRDKSGFWAFP